SYRGAIVYWALLLGSAFIAAPHSCEWGLATYTWMGVLGLVGLPAMTLLFPNEERPGRRGLRILVLVLGTLAVWVAGLFIANVRIVCRLF
ncbi:MAG TPA: hypothetical protein VG712_01575, partial [Gemmatimonadales bacterium]|nr:hypothetical protein [Gemmatimonadales bacterium]